MLAQLPPARVCVLQLAQGTVDAKEERLPEAVESQPTTIAVEQPHAKLALQAGEGSAQRRLADVELLGRAGDVLLRGDHLEVAQLEKIHLAVPYVLRIMTLVPYRSGRA
jgi:hypothetical protein